MHETKALTIPRLLIERVVRGRAAVNLLLVIGASALIAIAAQIAIPVPFSPVPLTLQPLAVLLVGATLGSTRGAAAAALYLLEGFSGLPVFAQGHGGAVWMFAATAGYLWSYPAAAWLAGFFSERNFPSLVPMTAGMTVIYLGGWSWLAAISSPAAAYAMGVAPFLLGDAIKVAIGAAVLPAARRAIARLM
ncbi:MAG TPA: biotin transporter BioY [Thermoanaerobaculia bacterium]|jgi:biotin transport system substrate-specific component|nr:biotin transporter BioY [Thermoanaerobaculia bacterium]